MNSRPYPNPITDLTKVNANASSQEQLRQALSTLNALLNEVNQLQTQTGGLKRTIQSILSRIIPFEGYHDSYFINNNVLLAWPASNITIGKNIDGVNYQQLVMTPGKTSVPGTVVFQQAAGSLIIEGSTLNPSTSAGSIYLDGSSNCGFAEATVSGTAGTLVIGCGGQDVVHFFPTPSTTFTSSAGIVTFTSGIHVVGTSNLAATSVTTLSASSTATLSATSVTTLSASGTSTLAGVSATSLSVSGTSNLSGTTATTLLVQPATDADHIFVVQNVAGTNFINVNTTGGTSARITLGGGSTSYTNQTVNVCAPSGLNSVLSLAVVSSSNNPEIHIVDYQGNGWDLFQAGHGGPLRLATLAAGAFSANLFEFDTNGNFQALSGNAIISGYVQSNGSGFCGPALYPVTDGTAAVQIQNNSGSPVCTFDTTNKIVYPTHLVLPVS